MTRWISAVILFLFLVPLTTIAAISGSSVAYKDKEVELEGYLALPTDEGKKPAVLVIHAWKGLDDYAKKRADQLAEMGYVGFAVDMYGKGVRASTTEEAQKLSSIYKKDRQLMRQRIRAALDFIKKHPRVQSSKVAAQGYCFGGSVALELARSGADVAGVTSFHGNLDTPNVKEAKKIKAKVLVLHGASDPYVTPEQVETFRQEMEAAKVDWQMVSYGGAVHSFTEKAAGNNKGTGVAYDEKADRRSWEVHKEFLAEIFKK